MVRLENVMDIRTGQVYSEVIVKERNAKWFEPVEQAEEQRIMNDETSKLLAEILERLDLIASILERIGKTK